MIVNRIEKVSVTDKYGLAKVVGTLASISGATVITFLKGPALLNSKNPFGFLSSSAPTVVTDLETSEIENWTLGCLYILGNCLAWSGWMVLQVPVLKKYPARLSLTAFTCLFGIIQFMVISLFVERDIEVWKISSAGEFLTMLYAVCAIYCSVFLIFNNQLTLRNEILISLYFFYRGLLLQGFHFHCRFGALIEEVHFLLLCSNLYRL